MVAPSYCLPPSSDLAPCYVSSQVVKVFRILGDNKALAIGLAKRTRTLAFKLGIDEKVLAPSEKLNLSKKEEMFKTNEGIS